MYLILDLTPGVGLEQEDMASPSHRWNINQNKNNSESLKIVPRGEKESAGINSSRMCWVDIQSIHASTGKMPITMNLFQHKNVVL